MPYVPPSGADPRGGVTPQATTNAGAMGGTPAPGAPGSGFTLGEMSRSPGSVPIGGWAGNQGYAEQQLGDLAADPMLVLSRMLGGQGALGPGFGALASYPAPDLNMWMLANGLGDPTQLPTPESFGNFYQKYYSGVGVPGQRVNLEGLLANLNQASGNGNTLLGQQLTGGTPAANAATYAGLLNSILQFLPDPIASAYRTMIARAGLNYASQPMDLSVQNAGNVTPFNQYIARVLGGG